MKRLIFRTLAVVAAALLPLGIVLAQSKEEISREKILAYGKEWQAKYDSYEPAPDMAEALKAKLGSDTRIDVYLGLWCPDSRNNVPPFIRIIDGLGSAVPVRYFALPRKASKDVKYYDEQQKVERVPTFIFYQDGREIGRIVENPKTGMLEDMMEVFFK